MGITDRRNVTGGDTSDPADRRYGISLGVAVKAPAKLATTGNQALSGLDAIDGVTPLDGDRILVWQQANAVDNGIWLASSGQWSRATDFNGFGEVRKGTRVYVTDGVSYAGREFFVTTPDVVKIGTDEINFTMGQLITNVAPQPVVGPNSATVGNLPFFSNADGKHLDDSGIPADSLAPLDSPVFINSPRAPTATSGDSSNQIANTEFVEEAITTALAGAGGNGAAEFKTVAAVQAANLPGTVEAVRTLGYGAVGDDGGALYARVVSEPSHAGKIQSADGAWWELSVDVPTPQMFGAKGDAATDDFSAFDNAIAYAVGGRVRVPYTASGYKLSDTLKFGAVGRARELIGDAYVVLLFDNLANTKDGVQIDFAGNSVSARFSGLTVDLQNADASNATYTKGRDGIRLMGGEWPEIDARIQNCGRDGFHIEADADFKWTENGRFNLRIFNCGRDGVHLNCANFNAIFINELNFENLEVRRWKRHAVHSVVNTLTATYGAAKISNIAFPKINLDANRNAVDMTATDLIYFEKNTGAPNNGLFEAFTFGSGGWENVLQAMIGYGISGDSGATVRNMRVDGPIIMFNITAPSNDPYWRLVNYGILTRPYLIFDTVDPGRYILGIPTNVADNFALSAFISPSQITSDQNNYTTSGLHRVFSVRLTTDAPRNITGLEAGVEDGELKYLRNANTTAGRSITLKDESSSSTAANRFSLGGADYVIPPGQGVLLRYASTSSRWEMLSFGRIVDPDGTFAANSDDRIATQKAVKTYVDGIVAAQDAMVFKGVQDCSGNPNYPAADRGHTYRVSVAGKIGGASGVVVEVGDMFICLDDATPSGDQATVGSHWAILQTNIDGAVVGPASATSGNVATFNGSSGKTIQDSGKALPSGAIVGNTDTQTLSGKTINTGNNSIVGITDGSDAGAGKIGEYLSSFIPAGSAVSLTTAVAKTVTSITLTPGDWDVDGFIFFNCGASTTFTRFLGGIYTTTDTLPTFGSNGPGYSVYFPSSTPGNVNAFGATVGRYRYNVTTNTTIYLVARAHFTVDTMAAYGYIQARRVR